MAQIVLYFLRSTLVLSFYIDVVLTLSIDKMNSTEKALTLCFYVFWMLFLAIRNFDQLQCMNRYGVVFAILVGLWLSYVEA